MYCLISDKGRLDCFQKLKDKYDLENQDFFRYLQVRAHFICDIKTTGEGSSGLINILTDAYKSKLNRKDPERSVKLWMVLEKDVTYVTTVFCCLFE